MGLLRAAPLVVVLFGTRAGPAAADPPPPLPRHVQEALTSYLRYPVAYADVLLATMPEERGPLQPTYALALGDAALRTGRYRLATDLFTQVREGDAGASFSSIAEVGLAWTMLGRGRLDQAYEHLAAAGALNPELQPATDIALALVAAAREDPDAGAALAGTAARSDLDPAFREAAPLLAAYARLWSGDARGAANAFSAFAVAHPDSRFTDDALFAAAQAKARAGETEEARRDLEALASGRRDGGGASSRLVDLDARALLRDGVRRDRELGARTLPQRFADLLDGDGARLARAALAAWDREAARAGEDEGWRSARAAKPSTGRGPRLADDQAEPDRSGASAPGRGPLARRSPASDETAAPPVSWTIIIAFCAALLLLALWRLAWRRPDRAGPWR
jgi:tetratricopeptide (TPR) repeat protein